MVARSECYSRSSRHSSTSQAATRARADAEAALTRAQYAKRQIDIEVEKARIEATLNALKKEGEAEAALAAAHVLEAAADEEHHAIDLTEQGISPRTPPSIRRARDYVNAHFTNFSSQVKEEKPDTGQLVSHNDSHYLQQNQKPVASSPGEHLTDFVDREQLKSPSTYIKMDISPQPRPSATPQMELSHLAAYLARRDLLTTGFKVFDNRPESYLSWKSIFCNAIEGLNLKPSEELDLLTKWLSGESLQHALRIRAVHVNNPQAGLQRLWQRLDKSYGSPEVVEASLFQRLQTFPRISNKDTHLLQELADLLLELDHRAKDCKAIIQCSECNSDVHVSAMHAGPPPWTPKDSNPLPQSHGGESDFPSTVTTTSCTEVCGQGLKGKSCSKICLVNVYPRSSPEKKRRMYAMLDDQSNSSLARSAFFDMFNVKGAILPYTMKTCAGLSEIGGRRASDFVIEDVNGKVSMLLPILTECDQIPDNRDEIPTSEAASAHPHLQTIASQIPPLDPSAKILLLLGRDIIEAHKVRSQVNGPNSAPYAQRLDLGWVVIGDVCLSGAHKPTVNTYKTNILDNGRPTFLRPCENKIHIKDKYIESCHTLKTQAELGRHIFQQTADDDKVALSAEDALFLDIMHKDFTKDDANNWVAPLPFRTPRQRLPNNRDQALSRLMSLRKTLKRKPQMREHYVEFLDKIFSKDHAEPAPALTPDQECWYLPSFGVYHHQKPEKN
ncbi:hypothetical protein ROHU_009677 [Labeo rohita]|uniref:Uncharacterized protein n=1 Tax=Labeo rohita TaxID=84645 RepID=A0A498LY76_LABRO|nr:hypothetical protein ROHU_009677 [Labeo rohita]